MEIEKPIIGSIIVVDGKRMEVVDVTPILTPYTKKNQDTRLEGYSISVREYQTCRLCLNPIHIRLGYCARHGASMDKPLTSSVLCAYNGLEQRSKFSQCSPGIGNRKNDI